MSSLPLPATTVLTSEDASLLLTSFSGSVSSISDTERQALLAEIARRGGSDDAVKRFAGLAPENAGFVSEALALSSNNALVPAADNSPAPAASSSSSAAAPAPVDRSFESQPNVAEVLHSFLIGGEELERLSPSDRAQLYDKIKLVIDGKISAADSGLLPLDRFSSLVSRLDSETIAELDGNFEEYQRPSFLSFLWNAITPFNKWRLPRQLPFPNPVRAVLNTRLAHNTASIAQAAHARFSAARNTVGWYAWVCGSAVVLVALPIGIFSALDSGVASYTDFPSRKAAHYPEALEL